MRLSATVSASRLGCLPPGPGSTAVKCWTGCGPRIFSPPSWPGPAPPPASSGGTCQTERVAVVNRGAAEVKKVVRHFPEVFLLIIDTPSECVIGGRRAQMEEAIKSLGCEAVYLEGVVTVHCEAVVPVKDAYRDLHVFPVMLPEGVRFYSCARAESYRLTSDNAAQSILDQALYGFDFTDTINQAYKDGVR